MTYEAILLEKSANIGYVTLNRPQVLNAINFQMRQELAEAFAQLEIDPEVRVVVLSGAGKRAFSVGADIKEFDRPQAELGWEKWSSIGISDKPIIAAIQGYCLGAGFQMVLRCDLRIATQNAQFGLPEITLGIMTSDGGSQRLPRLVGITKALEMTLTGEMITAQEAYDFKLVNKVVPNEELLPVTKKLAEVIASKDPDLVKIYKKAIYRGSDLPLNSALELEQHLAQIANKKLRS